MTNTTADDELVKKTLSFAKIIAMVGVSSIKKEESTNIKRRPSIVVMKYLQEFGYRVIPVNPFAVGKKIQVGLAPLLVLEGLNPRVSSYVHFKKITVYFTAFFFAKNYRIFHGVTD